MIPGMSKGYVLLVEDYGGDYFYTFDTKEEAVQKFQKIMDDRAESGGSPPKSAIVVKGTRLL